MHPRNISHPHAVLDVEVQLEVVHRVLALRKLVWNELLLVSREGQFGVGG